jgi:flagella basal body P-ring formation protein FlgA
MLAAAIVVLREDSVIIEVTRGSLTIRTSGTALRSGKKGEQIPVRNDKSGRVIKAFVISPGLVRTP